MNRFNAKKETQKIVNFIKEYYQNNNLGGAIIGISGGKDSAVVAALFTKALGKENVIGVTMPCHSNEDDKIDANLISNYYGFKMLNFDITNVFDNFKKELGKLGNYNFQETKNSDINLKPRLRMATLYYLAALYSAIKGKTYLVAGTSNKCELYVGYFTKGGDSVYDISVLADLTVAEVILIGKYLKVPKKVLYKKPNDGLSNLTDEDKLGIKYSEIASYIKNKNSIAKKQREIIECLHNSNKHKFIIPTYKKDV